MQLTSRLDSRKLVMQHIDVAAVLAFSLPFIVYVVTLAPTIYNLDSAELTTAAATGGIIRATGYPLYSILGWLMAQLPIGDVGYRLNLLSALCGATTILLADYILRRLRVGRWARVGALGLLATAPYFWAMSLIAEVYTLHTMLMAAVILALLRWAEQPSPLRFALPIALMALSMGNHVSTILLVPACIWYVVATAPRDLLCWRNWLAAAIGLVIGGTVFFYLPLRYGADPVFNYAGEYDANGVFHQVDLHTLDGFLWLVTGRSFSGVMFGYALTEVPGQIAHYMQELWQAFFIVGIGPGIYGAWLLLKRDWRFGVTLLLMFATNVIFYINYNVVDKATMFLPTYLVWALWLGIGYQALLTWLIDESVERRAYRSRRRRHRPAAPKWQAPALVGLILFAVVLAFAWNLPRVSRAGDTSVRELGESILRHAEPDAVIFGWWDSIPVVEYLQLVEGERLDVTAINRFLMPGDDMVTFILQEVENRPIYIDNPPLSLVQQLDVTRDGPLYRLAPLPSPTTR